jgi:hypothetical protein
MLKEEDVIVEDGEISEAQAWLEELLLEGLDSGEEERIMPEFFQELKKDFVAKALAR